MQKNILFRNKAILVFIIFAFGYFLSCLHRVKKKFKYEI